MVVRRQQLVRTVEAELQTLPRGGSGALAEQAHDELVAFVETFMAHLSSLSSRSCPSEAPAAMALTLRCLDDLTDALKVQARRRPSAESRAFLVVALELGRLWAVYREALITTDMARAQTLAGRGQSILDGAPLALKQARLVSEAAGVLGEQKTEPSLARRVFRALALRYPGLALDALAVEGARRVHEVVGVEVGAGSAVDYLAVEVVVSAYLDPEAFKIKLCEASSACGNVQRLCEVASMDDAVQGLQLLRRDVFETLNQFTQVAEQENRDSAVVRRFVKTVGELYESALPLLVWLRLLTGNSTGADRYNRFVKESSTALVEKFERHLPRTCGDMPSYLRNSAHHGRAFEFDETSGVLSFQLKSCNDQIALDDYLDQALAMVESLLAANWVLSAALDRVGVGIPIPPDDAQYMGLYQHDFAALWLEQQHGIENVRSEVRDGSWTIDADLPSGQELVTAIALAQNAGRGIERVTVLTPGASRDPVEIDLDDYVRYSEQPAQDPAVAVVEMLDLRHRATCAGACLLTEKDVEFAVVALAAQMIVDGQLGLVKPLRRARHLAQIHQMDDLARLAASAIATLRSDSADDLRAQIGPRIATTVQPGLPTSQVVTVHLSPQPRRRPCDLFTERPAEGR